MKGCFNIFLISLFFIYSCQDEVQTSRCVNGKPDKSGCICHLGYGGANCTEKACPYGMAEIDTPFGDLNGDLRVTNVRVKTEWYPMGFGIRETGSGVEHPYRECSSAGKCDRKTGKCQCNPGYFGSACDKKGCIPPTSKDNKMCNGNGECLRGKDIKFINGKTVYEWKDYYYYGCICYYPWSGTFCDRKQCEYGYDPDRFTTDFIFAYTLDSGVKEDAGSTVSHYYVFKYRSKTYTSAVMSEHKKICENDKLNNDKAKNFKESLYKILRVFPYFGSFSIELRCTNGGTVENGAYNDGKFLTVRLKLDYMNIDSIKKMEFNVYKKGTTNVPAIKDGVNGNGEIVANSPNALWLMRYSEKIGTEITCYINGKYKKEGNEKMMKDPIDLKTLCSGENNGQISIFSDSFEVKGQNECGGRGNCNRDAGKCECFKNYYGIACTLKGAV